MEISCRLPRDARAREIESIDIDRPLGREVLVRPPWQTGLSATAI